MIKIWTMICLGGMLMACYSLPLAEPSKRDQIKNLTSPTEGMAGVYIFGGRAGHDVWLNGRCLGFAGHNGFFYIEIESDKEHIISTDNLLFPEHLKFTTVSGKFYYIEQYARFWSWNILLHGPIPSDLRYLTAQQGRKKLASTLLVEQNSCLKKAMKLPQ